MRIRKIYDVGTDALSQEMFDVGIYFCGYEERSSYMLKTRTFKISATRKICIAYEEEPVLHKLKNLKKFMQTPGMEILKIESGTERELFCSVFADLEKYVGDDIKIFVDYSSMRRDVYTELLNTFFFSIVSFRRVEVVFGYSIGRYGSSHAPKYVERHESLPGMDGRTSQKRNKLAVFNLGFEPVSSLTMAEAIEADKLIGVVASPGASARSKKKCLALNKDMLSSYLHDHVFEIPLRSVSAYCRFASEHVGRYTDEYDVVFVPNGPKPHVLGSIASCLNNRSWTNIYIRGVESRKTDVSATGECVITRFVIDKKHKELGSRASGV